MGVNVALLEEVMSHIETYPEQHGQNQWAVKADCGTAYCFAGHAALMSGAEFEFEGDLITNRRWADGTIGTSECLVDGDVRMIDSYAQEVLGLRSGEANVLFAGSNTIPELRDMVDRLKSGVRLRARVTPAGCDCGCND